MIENNDLQAIFVNNLIIQLPDIIEPILPVLAVFS